MRIVNVTRVNGLYTVETEEKLSAESAIRFVVTQYYDSKARRVKVKVANAGEPAKEVSAYDKRTLKNILDLVRKEFK